MVFALRLDRYPGMQQRMPLAMTTQFGQSNIMSSIADFTHDVLRLSYTAVWLVQGCSSGHL